jgi:hypothetical protein
VKLTLHVFVGIGRRQYHFRVMFATAAALNCGRDGGHQDVHARFQHTWNQLIEGRSGEPHAESAQPIGTTRYWTERRTPQAEIR